MIVVSIGTNPTFKVRLIPMEYVWLYPSLTLRHQYLFVLVDLQMSNINVDSYGFFLPVQWEGGANLLQTLFLRKKYNKNIDGV